MEFKGTKGKWKVDKWGKDSSGRACYRIHTYIRPMDSQMKANAQLISKAPEYHADALKDLALYEEIIKELSFDSYLLNEISKRLSEKKQLIKEATTF